MAHQGLPNCIAKEKGSFPLEKEPFILLFLVICSGHKNAAMAKSFIAKKVPFFHLRLLNTDTHHLVTLVTASSSRKNPFYSIHYFLKLFTIKIMFLAEGTVDPADIEDLFDQLEDLSDSGPDVDTISIGSTPKPSLKPFFCSSRNLLNEASRVAQGGPNSGNSNTSKKRLLILLCL